VTSRGWLSSIYALAAIAWLGEPIGSSAQPAASVKDYEAEALREYRAQKAEAEAQRRIESAREAKRRAALQRGQSSSSSAAASDVPRLSNQAEPKIDPLSMQVMKQIRSGFCYVIPSGGADAARIISVIQMKLDANGEVLQASVIKNEGITDINQPYVLQMNDAALRALQRCSPLKLFRGADTEGSADFVFSFYPRLAG